MNSYIKNTPQFEHSVFSEIKRSSPLGSILKIRRTTKREMPDIVHLHSTFAGFYGRLLALKFKLGCSKCPEGVRKYRPQIVYSPHCYAFERLDLSPLMRKIYYCIEKLFARRTSAFALCSEYETSLTKKFLGRKVKPAVFVPNVSSLADLNLPEGENTFENSNDTFTVAMSGRISPQKDPTLFSKISQNASEQGINAQFIWIGDTAEKPNKTDAELKLNVQTNAEVTGWRPPSEVRKILQNTDVYLHTAAWEGFPVAILDAVALGRPVIVRNATYLENCPKTAIFDDFTSGAKILHTLLESSELRAKNVQEWQNALKDNTNAVQGERLTELYKTISTK